MQHVCIENAEQINQYERQCKICGEKWYFRSRSYWSTLPEMFRRECIIDFGFNNGHRTVIFKHITSEVLIELSTGDYEQHELYDTGWKTLYEKVVSVTKLKNNPKKKSSRRLIVG